MAVYGPPVASARLGGVLTPNRLFVKTIFPRTVQSIAQHNQHDRQQAHQSASSSSRQASPLDVRVKAVAASLELPQMEQARLQQLPLQHQTLTRPSSKPAQLPDPHLSYEFIQGPLVRWSEVNPGTPPPTAVLVHGILGSRGNLKGLADRITREFPAWQVLLVDLRCHGESACLASPSGGHTVEAAAGDVLKLLQQLKLFPAVLIGHSFGGKVVMSMADQFGKKTPRLHKPVQVWVLDALPGEVRAGIEGGKDHPANLISHLLNFNPPVMTKDLLRSYLLGHGFSNEIANWTAKNLRPKSRDERGYMWTFDLKGIQDLYRSYEESDLWPFLLNPALGISVKFVRAERSTFRWASDEDRIRSAGHEVHLLRDSGHWVHVDNPDGLFKILSTSFGTQDLHPQGAVDQPRWSTAPQGATGVQMPF